MIKYILKRLGLGLLTLFILIVITFTLTKVMPGSPLQSKNISGDVLAKMEAQYGLDKPVVTQLFIYIKNMLHGDLGTSYKKTGTSVTSIIKQSMIPTMKLGLVTTVLVLVVGIFAGIMMAKSKSPVAKGAWLTGLTLGVSIPNFLVALLLMILFGVIFKALPIIGLSTPLHYILPALAQGLWPISAVARLTQSSYEEVIRQDYITMAKAKGISKSTILFRHVLKNAMLPVITYIGPMVAFLLTGSVTIEKIFTIPGLGREFTNAIMNHDYTVVMGITIFMGALIIMCNLIADLLCAVIDPRTRKSL
ncbi:MAG: ABC transporter permease [Treponema sp.]|nr:ABC transporter permease [Treponema sp.]MCI7566685.1 ABC transporter permease [Treponema sp.]